MTYLGADGGGMLGLVFIELTPVNINKVVGNDGRIGQNYWWNFWGDLSKHFVDVHIESKYVHLESNIHGRD